MKIIILICLTTVLVVSLIVGCVTNAINRICASRDTDTVSREFNNYLKIANSSSGKNMEDFLKNLTAFAATIGESNKK